MTRDAVAGARAAGSNLQSAAPSFDDLVGSGLGSRSTQDRSPACKKLVEARSDRAKRELVSWATPVYAVAAAAGHLAAVLHATDRSAARSNWPPARAVVAPLLDDMVAAPRRRPASSRFRICSGRTDLLLRTSAGVRREVVAGIDHLLVDEFQDTDRIQCEIVRRIGPGGRCPPGPVRGRRSQAVHLRMAQRRPRRLRRFCHEGGGRRRHDRRPGAKFPVSDGDPGRGGGAGGAGDGRGGRCTAGLSTARGNRGPTGCSRCGCR